MLFIFTGSILLTFAFVMATAMSLISNEIELIFCKPASNATVPEPEKGSIKTSPSLEKVSIKWCVKDGFNLPEYEHKE